MRRSESTFSPRFVSEVDVKIGPLDLILSHQTLMPFIKMTRQLCQVKTPPARSPQTRSVHVNEKEEEEGTNRGRRQQRLMDVHSNNLPLVYLKSKTFRVFFMSDQQQDTTSSVPGKLDRVDLNHAALNPDVLVFNCDSVVVTPQVENPLSRMLVRPQLFHLCRTKGILNIPGK